MTKLTSKQVNPPNPTGKGGFIDHPENRNDRGLAKTPIFYINHYGALPAEEVTKALKKSDKEKTTHEKIALSYIAKSVRDPKDYINRLDGSPTQKTEISGKDGESIEIRTDFTPEQKKKIRDFVTEVMENNG